MTFLKRKEKIVFDTLLIILFSLSISSLFNVGCLILFGFYIESSSSTTFSFMSPNPFFLFIIISSYSFIAISYCLLISSLSDSLFFLKYIFTSVSLIIFYAHSISIYFLFFSFIFSITSLAHFSP